MEQIHFSDWRPFSWMDEKGNVHGFIKDVVDVVCKHLNLTLAITDTRNNTKNSWFKK